MIQDLSLRLRPEEAANADRLAALVAERIGERVNAWRIIRRSIDARQREVYVNLTIRVATGDDAEVLPEVEPFEPRDVSSAEPVIIVGSGPAGLFAALRCLERGLRPVVLERGKPVDERRRILAEMSQTGVVDPDCNYSFGEGGAGTFSDGKLYTRSNKRGNIRQVLSLFHRFGAEESVLVDAHPHIGTNRLGDIIKSMRQCILEHGGQMRFDARVADLIIEENRIRGVMLRSGEELHAQNVVLATGHSARDIYTMLQRRGVRMEPKGLAIGTRVEHPQALIDRIQYHSREGRGSFLPPAEYSFSTQVEGRGVYSFCMCPGGTIVPAATGPEQSVVNGMSASARGSRWSNAGIVVELHPGDFPQFEGDLQMMHLQEWLEERFYDDAVSHGCENLLNAPAQRLTDFVKGRESSDLPPSSYAPGIHPARIDCLLPPFISRRLQRGYKDFDSRRHGFLTPDACLIGLESRTSAPVKVSRDPKTLQHVEIQGLYPAGEGAGYAGGIVSAAMDGIRCIDAIAGSK